MCNGLQWQLGSPGCWGEGKEARGKLVVWCKNQGSRKREHRSGRLQLASCATEMQGLLCDKSCTPAADERSRLRKWSGTISGRLQLENMQEKSDSCDGADSELDWQGSSGESMCAAELNQQVTVVGHCGWGSHVQPGAQEMGIQCGDWKLI